MIVNKIRYNFFINQGRRHALKSGGAKFSEVGGPTMVGSGATEKILDCRPLNCPNFTLFRMK